MDMEPEKVDVVMGNQQSTKDEEGIKVQDLEVKDLEKVETAQNVSKNQVKKNPLMNSPKKEKQQNENNKQKEAEQKKPDQVKEANEQKQITQKQIIQEINLDSTNILIQRPITINLGTDAIQMEKHSNMLDKEPQIKIEIVDSVDKGFALNRQTFFKIIGFDKHGQIEIFRRFEEFESLRRILLERWPGCFVTHLSLKSDIKSDHYRNLHKWNNLKQFLAKLTWFEEIYYKEEVQLFLRCIGIDIEEMFTQMPTLRVKDIIERFKASYGEDQEKVSSPENSAYISNFSTSLKKVSHNLNNISKKMLKLAEAYENYQTALPKFSNFLMRYEQVCLSEYTNDPNTSIAHKDSNQKLNKLKTIQEKTNIFYDFYFLLESQNRDADALLQVILAMQMFTIKRDELQQTSKEIREQIDQISLGHKNIKVMTSRKPKQQIQKELEQRQKKIIADKHSVLQLAGIAEVILATVSIPTFRKMKINNYFQIIKKWVDTVGQLNTDIYEVWKYLHEEGEKQLKNIS